MAYYNSVDDFMESLSFSEPPEELNSLLQALWFDAKGDWNSAHELIQGVYTPQGAWVHAYLHRKEGDHENAKHWYGKAGKKVPDFNLQEEWKKILEDFLEI